MSESAALTAPLPELRAVCRYCRADVVLGKHGWRLDVNDPSAWDWRLHLNDSAYDCPDAPRGYHGAGETGGDRDTRPVP